ncbi:hypothetical protein Syun_013154 [Stephania yunnanensis]|uniref:Fe2OG dioxygenase domain-containing protein n=1 Tax=Stephania yunnanensis TaxID=152371 RepID=A0AAP0PIA6_9MAGN
MSVSHNTVQLPVLDFSRPLQVTSLSSLREACKEWGFFHITNHGISKDLLGKLYLLSKQLFCVPIYIKMRIGPSSSIGTYIPHFIASPFYESVRVSGPDFFTSAKSSTDVLFNSSCSELCEVLQEYCDKMSDLSKKILKILLMCLGDSVEKYFESEFSECHGYLRIINYSPPESVTDEEVEGLGMHTDMSCLTIVYQDEVGGLQVRSKEGKWMDINPCEGTLVVNVGDLMHAWSNGRLRSSEHRVVLKRNINRIALAFFWCFEDEKVIWAPEEVVGEGNARVYGPFVCSDYLKFRESTERGNFDKVGFTVKDFARDPLCN